jgi:electron transfer flavoprotein alpha subunit
MPPKILVLAEHDHGQLKLATLSAISFAHRVVADAGGTFEILVLGSQLGQTTEGLRQYGAAAVLAADDAQLEHPLADRYAQVLAEVLKERGATMVVATASTFSKDILPRAAALADSGMLSDVIDVRREGSDWIFRRVMFAGNVIATAQLEGPLHFITVRASAFAPPEPEPSLSELVNIPVQAVRLPQGTQYLGRDPKLAGRPDSTEARVVVSGGRGIRNAEDFERLIGGLADALGGAVGSSRALVDAGVTPNSLQVGQTGKIVAPNLYIAVGISGAIQHLAGIKDTRVIVAINKDPEAPIFEIADFGLVADVYQAVPEMVAKLKS